MHHVVPFIVLFFAFTLAVGPAYGQDSLQTNAYAQGPGLVIPSDQSTHATLEGWAADRRLYVLDRHDGYGDLFYDRGVFRHITPLMDHEYDIDMVSYEFSLIQDRVWSQLGSGMRMGAISTSRQRWEIRTEVKNSVELADSHRLHLDIILERGAQAQRAFVEFSYDWEAFPHHYFGLRHTVTQYKPDFDISFFYQYGNDWDGMVRFEGTLLDIYNNFIFDVLGPDSRHGPYVTSYKKQPYLLQLSFASPAKYALRGELYSGWQPQGRLRVTSQDNAAMRYRDQEQAHYLGALVEYDFGAVTIGMVYQRDRSALDRQGLGADLPSDYWSKQRFERGGTYVIGSWGTLRGEAWFFLADYYDRQQGNNFSLSTLDGATNWSEYRKRYRARISYTPQPTGLYAAVEYSALSRRLNRQAARFFSTQWSRHSYLKGPSNYRSTFMLGYRFGSAEFVAGKNFDLDGDDRRGFWNKSFDSGFFRFAISW